MLDRDLGEQSIARLLRELGLRPSDLVAASSEQLTYKMVSRAMRGRRLTANAMRKVRRAWELVAAESHRERPLFDHEP